MLSSLLAMSPPAKRWRVLRGRGKPESTTKRLRCVDMATAADALYSPPYISRDRMEASNDNNFVKAGNRSTALDLRTNLSGRVRCVVRLHSVIRVETERADIRWQVAMG